MPDYKTIRKDDGTLTIVAADELAAKMLIAAYVPDFEELGLSFEDAYALALVRDDEATWHMMQDAQNAECEPKDPIMAAKLAERLAYVADLEAQQAEAEAWELQQAEEEYSFIVNTLLGQSVEVVTA